MFLSHSTLAVRLDPTSAACLARGCLWDSGSDLALPACYVPKEKGGYQYARSEKQLSNSIVRYNLSRLSIKPNLTRLSHIYSTNANEFSMYGHDIDHLTVDVSHSGMDMMRLTIRDATKDRYEVPVPVQWQGTSPSIPSNIKFDLTKTTHGQVGLRVRRLLDTRSILFDTTVFAHGFVYDDKFLQVISTIPSRNVYGERERRIDC